MIISKTPLRISFLGGNTDYPDYCIKKNGITIGSTINKYIYVSVNKNYLNNYKYKISYYDFQRVKRIEDIQNNFIRNLLNIYKLNHSIDINITSDLPSQLGLGSSGSFSVGFNNVLNHFSKKNISSHQLFINSYKSERNINKYVGYQDFAYPCFGGFKKFSYNKDRIIKIIDYDNDNIRKIEKSISIIYFKRKIGSSEITKDIKKNLSYSRTISNLDEIANISNQGHILLKSKNFQLKEFGELLNYYWSLKKKISKKINNYEIDNLINKLSQIKGVYGLKLLGAGSGGCICVLSNLDVKKKLKELYKDNYIDIKFTKNRSKIFEIK